MAKYYHVNRCKALAAGMQSLFFIRYHAKNRLQRCADMNRRYRLAEPKTLTQDLYIIKAILSECTTLTKLTTAFKNEHCEVSNKAALKRAVASVAVKRLVRKVLQIRRYQAGSLLKAVRSINKIV